MDWTWILPFLAYLTPGFAYYHLKSERIFSLPSNPGAVFGFSVSSVYSGPSARLLVGAPLADHTGMVYTCDLNDPTNTCKSADKPPIKRFVEQKNYTDLNYWYGATVMGTNDYFVACSPLLIDKDGTIFQQDPVGTFGRCVLHQKPNAQNLLPTINGLIRKGSYTKFENIIDSFGWSLNVDNDGTVLIGGPAMITGRVLKLKVGSSSTQYETGSKSKDSFNFGYSVAYGKFLGTKKKDISIAVGSTYGTHGKGRVTIFTESMIVRKQIVGPKVGFMFGATLCPAKLTVTDQDSLLVGAPAYATEDNYNVGAVYVYITNAKRMIVQKRIIEGEKSSSYFGSAIISLGDLDDDEIDEIAISAPYYKDHGAVYLYSGADIMKNGELKPMQIIEPENTITTFGYSLSALRDYDDNGCNELAIGAPDSNTVKVLRCLAGITIKLMKFPSIIAGTKGSDKTERLDVCFTARFPVKPTNVIADININVEFDHEGVSGGGDVLINLRTKTNDPYCKKVDMRMSGTKGNFNDKIKYKLTASLKNDPSTRSDFRGEEVILNKQSILTLNGYIWAQECGNKACVPKLSLQPTFTEMSPYTIGSSPSINATMLVNNTGDVAYDACLRVKVLGAGVPRPPGSCTQLESDDAEVLLLCKPKQLLRKEPPWITDLALDTTQLTNEDTKIEVKISLYNECDKNVTDEHEMVYQLSAVTDSIEVHGRTDDVVGDVVNLKRSDIAARKSFEQVYTISNGGPTNWVNIPITISVKNEDFLATSVYVEDQMCMFDNATDSEYHCLVMKLDRDAGIDVKVHMQTNSDDLSDRLSQDSLTIYSEIDVVLDSINKVANVTTELKLVEGKVPIWIIIVASILALIILLILFFILRECGVLERKNKKNLQAARMSVRRQTVLRQSMMNRPRSQDQQNLIAEEAASQVNKKKKKDRRVVVNDF